MRYIPILILFFSTQMFAQNGTIKSSYKISQTQGNFPLTIGNYGGLGTSLASLGDFDNDGISDIVTSSVNGSDDGRLFITFLNSNGTVKSVVEIKRGVSGLPSTLPNLDVDMDFFGHSVDTIGDLNGDGIIDLVVGIPRLVGGNARGHVMILFMNANGTVNSYEIIGQNDGGFNDALTNTYFGYSVAGIGDIDKDGVLDIAVGGEKRNSYKGAVWILFLNTDGSVKSYNRIDETSSIVQSYFNQSNSPNYRFGSSISNIGDLNKDGYIDIIVGSTGFRTNTGNGSATILFLDSTGTAIGQKAFHQGINNFNDTLINYWDSLLPNDNTYFGYSVASIGDINGDFITDIAIGAPHFSDSNCIKCGAIGVFMLDSIGNIMNYQRISNAKGGLSVNLDNDDWFGWAISGIGDFNGDRINDIIVSAKQDDDGGSDKGAMYILNLNGVPDTSPIKNVNQLSGVNIYPNPTNTNITIEFESMLKNESIWQIKDLIGNTLKTGILEQNCLNKQINVAGLSNGVYLIQIHNQNQVFSKKIVIAN